MSNPLDNIPAGLPPPGIIPNLVNPSQQGPTIVALDGIFVALMLVMVLIRIYVRARVVKIWGWDDYACIIAACGSIVHMVMYTQTVKIGFGRHIWDIPASWLVSTSNTRLLSANGITYPATILFARLSILLLYLRIFHVSQKFRIAVYFAITIQALFYTAIIGVAIGSLVECNGLEALTIQFCLNEARPIPMLNSVFNVIADFYVLVLPIPCVLKLQLRFRRKLGVSAVFAGGLIACAASLARLIELGINYKNPDVLWIQAYNAEFTIVEMNIAIMVACVSCLPAFFGHTKLFSSSLYHSIRSRLFSTTRSESGATFAALEDKDRSTSRKKPMVDTWGGSRTRLREENSVELRESTFDVVKVTGGRQGSGGAASLHNGIIRTTQFDVESMGRE